MKSFLAKLALAVVAPLLFFSLLEGGLRVGGFGRNLDFFVPDEQPGMYRTNPHFTELFFAASFGLKPVNFRLAKEKPAGTYRIFVVGESAAMGVPEPAFSVAPQLQAQLRAAGPDRKVEVFNLGVTAINSHAIRRVVRQAIEFHPDVLVIYMGNNEVVGPYGPGSVLSGGIPPRWVIRLGGWLRSMRTGQLMQRVVAALRPAGSDFKDWRGMEMFAHSAVSAEDPRLMRTYDNFAANLDDMLAVAHRAGVKVVLSTVAVNLRDCAPFSSQRSSTLSASQIDAVQRDVAEADRARSLGDTSAARRALERALTADQWFADTHFQLARVLDETGDTPAAREHYLLAMALDGLRFRTDARINQLIRLAARDHEADVTLVDAAKELGADARSTIPPAGANLFFEHVHFREEGNYALARLLAPAVWSALPGTGATAPAWLDAAACADAIGYTELGHLAMTRSMAELTGRPPFTGQSSYAEDRTRLLTEIRTVEKALSGRGAVNAAAARIDAVLQRDPQNPALVFQAAGAHLQAGELDRALELNTQLATLVPPSPEAAAQRTFLLLQLGRKNEAEELLLRTADEAPYYFQTYGLLAQLWSASNQLPKALDYFATLVARMPDSRGARNSYAQLLARNNDWSAAEQQWRAVLRLVPDDETALAPLLQYLARSNQRDEVLKLVQAAYAYNPRSFENNGRLVRLYEPQGNSEEMVRYLSALAASGPVNGRLYLDLALHLAKLGRHEEANAALARARRIASGEGDAATLKQIGELIEANGH